MLNDDYIEVPAAALNHIYDAPGWEARGKKLFAHRTHLPLIPRFYEAPSARSLAWQPMDGFKMRDYQIAGLGFMKFRFGSILGDQPRLGKTLQVCQTMDPRKEPCLVVAPLATRPVWLGWLKRVWPDAKVVVVKGRSYDREAVAGADIIFCHYEMLTHWEDFADRQFHTVAFDEAHVLSNPKSLRTHAAMRLSTRASHHVIAATGTPVWNKPGQIYTLLKLVSRGGWGTFQDFTERYASGTPGAYGWETGAPSNVEELQLRLKEVLIARTWKDVRDEVPATDYSVELATLTRREEVNIDKLAIAAQMDSAKETNTLIGENARLRKIVAKRKVKPAAAVAAQFLAAGEPVVIWTWHKDIANDIAAKLAKSQPIVITGDTPVPDREEFLARWRKGVYPLIMSLSIGQVGIDLSHARHAVFAEFDYTPAVISQAIMRTFAPERPMTVTFVAVDHPLEVALVRILSRKCRQAQELGVACADLELNFDDIFKEDVSSADLSELIAKL